MALPNNRRGVYVSPGPSWGSTTGPTPTPAFTRRNNVVQDQGLTTAGPADFAPITAWPDDEYARYFRLNTAAPAGNMARATLGDRARQAIALLLGKS